MKNFKEITKQLYRGSAPTPKEVLWMKDNLGIKKIISLDKESGEKISRTCKMLDIDHQKHYLNKDKASLIKLLSNDLKELALKNGPTFVHCLHGKDRTGLLIALIKVQYLNETPEKALEDAKSLGFGIGVDPRLISVYEKLIRGSKKDSNDASIVSNVREYKGDNKDSYLDQAQQGSFAPYISQTKQDPQDPVYNFYDDQYDRAERLNEPITKHKDKEQQNNFIPQNGVFNNDAGLSSAGPTVNMTGFIY